ncbi:hypothetical protein K458DRAFT_70449 [Lentithecium fluviatile CBS 122367]|uniref:Uncharacterized protein n=1 Tax=Lentithecium fluviatile CBS 122367 TaxID=1168545 RepID=A0A6G1JMH7_9PLEO|nr:hypothetical protein K458DRAFT_70449 [Lentithecium fluviatile CBS 122367]
MATRKEFRGQWSSRRLVMQRAVSEMSNFVSTDSGRVMTVYQIFASRGTTTANPFPTHTSPRNHKNRDSSTKTSAHHQYVAVLNPNTHESPSIDHILSTILSRIHAFNPRTPSPTKHHTTNPNHGTPSHSPQPYLPISLSAH